MLHLSLAKIHSKQQPFVPFCGEMFRLVSVCCMYVNVFKMFLPNRFLNSYNMFMPHHERICEFCIISAFLCRIGVTKSKEINQSGAQKQM